MRQLVYVDARKLVWQEVPEPVLMSAKDALVRPVAVSRCDLDLAVLSKADLISGPYPFGHEFVAEVVQTGTDVRTVSSGDRVVVPFQISCGDCVRCRGGLTGSCSAVPPLAAYGLGAIGGREWGGALTDVVRVPFADAMLLTVPSGIDDAVLASLSDNLPDAHRTVADLEPGSDVLVVGGASLGVLAAGMAVSLGAQVRYIDTDETRCRVVEGYGAAVDQRPLDSPVAPAGRVVHTSARPDQLWNAILSVDPGGEIVDTGIYWGGPTPLPLFEMYTTGVTFTTGRVQARAQVPATLDLIQSGRFDPSPALVMHTDWDDAVEALLQPGLKAVITRQ